MPSIRFGRKSIKLPESRMTRIGIGGAFVAGGVFSFLPVLGIWMLPVGLIIRLRRRLRRTGARLTVSNSVGSPAGLEILGG